MANQRYCEKCNRTMDEINFYKSNNLEKYPDGKLSTCKKCLTLHVDNWNPDTYLWILQECDVPYIPDEWNKLLASYVNKGTKITGLTIIGRYLSKMQLKQWRDFRWKDNEFLQDVANKKIKETMERQGFDVQQIADAVERASYSVPDKPLEIPEYVSDLAHLATGSEDYFSEQTDSAFQSTLDLSDEEKLAMRIKWGKMYKPEEWVQLEKLYQEMMSSYDIQTAAHIDTLKLICKTSLKANQLIDIGDVESYQKMSKVYNELMKAGNFTAAQNKSETSGFLDSVSELVSMCEKKGYIPQFYLDGPNDKVDETIIDMQRYTHTLITEETNFSQLLEDAVKKIQKEDENNDKDQEFLDNVGVEVDAVTAVERELQIQDYQDFSDFIDDEEISDKTLTDFLREYG